MEPASSALEGRFITTGPPGKSLFMSFKNKLLLDFPGSPMVKTLSFQCREWVCHPGQGTKIPQVKWVTLSHIWLFAAPWTVTLPGSSVHGIIPARMLQWVTISSSRGSSWPRDRTLISCIGRRILYQWPKVPLGKQINKISFLNSLLWYEGVLPTAKFIF